MIRRASNSQNRGGISFFNLGSNPSFNPGARLPMPVNNNNGANFGTYENPNCPIGGSNMIDDPNYDPRCYWSKPEYNHNHTFATMDHSNQNTGSSDHSNDQGKFLILHDV